MSSAAERLDYCPICGAYWDCGGHLIPWEWPRDAGRILVDGMADNPSINGDWTVAEVKNWGVVTMDPERGDTEGTA